MEKEIRYQERADLFLQEISEDIHTYERKWEAYFKEIGLPFDIDILNDTIVKCYDTISRLGLREGKKESFNYLFKSFKTNSLRELEYARNKNREEVEDINEVYERYMAREKSQDYKIVLDLWQEFQYAYLLREVELYWDKDTFYLFKLKYVLSLEDSDILKKSKNPDWKKDLRTVTKWLKNNVKQEDIKQEFNQKYPEIDLSLLDD